jgi:CDP-diglyceride synthetase
MDHRDDSRIEEGGEARAGYDAEWDDEPLGADDDPGSPPIGGRARITGVEAGIAAGLTPPAEDDDLGQRAPGGLGGAHFRQDVGRDETKSGPVTGAVPLPDWTDPPTREVPRAVLGPSSEQSQPVPGPVWREDDADWDLDSLAFAELVSEGTTVAEHGTGARDDLESDFEEAETRVVPRIAEQRPATGGPPTVSFPRPSDTAASFGAGRPGAMRSEPAEWATGAEADQAAAPSPGAPRHRKSQESWTSRIRRSFGGAPSRGEASIVEPGWEDVSPPEPADGSGGRRSMGRRSFTVSGAPSEPPERFLGPPADESPQALEPTVAVPPRPDAAAPPRGHVKFAGRDRAERHRNEERENRAAPPASSEPAAAATTDEERKEPFDGDREAALAEGAAGRRSPVVATATGLLIGAVTLLCFLAGPPAVLALACVALTIAMAECYQALRRAQYRPAALLGLLAAPGAAVAAYLKGPEGIVLVAALFTILVFCWYLFGLTSHRPVQNISATVLGWAWVGGLGSFVGLIASPTAFAHRHGLAFLLGAIEATVAYDVGGYLFGSWLGRHKLAPTISPNKTWEGLIGGSVCALAVAIAITALMSPWTLSRAAALGVVVAIVAPFGDLTESMIKRDLRVKDMGTLLPAHGGLLDRIDALLFVLPATYYLVRAFHG